MHRAGAIVGDAGWIFSGKHGRDDLGDLGAYLGTLVDRKSVV